MPDKPKTETRERPDFKIAPFDADAITFKADDDGQGTFEAVFSTMNVNDRDDDIVVNGAFGNQDVLISQYNHGSWDGSAKALPIGVGRIFERGDQGIVQGEFDMDDPDAVKTYEKMKYLTAKGRRQEFSYALPKVKSRWLNVAEAIEEFGVEAFEHNSPRWDDVRVIEKVEVPEVSPVLMGASVDTRLLSIKSRPGTNVMTLGDHVEVVTVEIYDLLKRLETVADLRQEKGKGPFSEATKTQVQLFFSRISELLDAAKRAGDQEPSDAERKDEALQRELWNERLRFEKIMTDLEVGAN